MATTMIIGTKRVAAISDGDHELLLHDTPSFRDTRRKIDSTESAGDTIFECQDGKEVYAFRSSLLMSRWVWLKEYLSADDARVPSIAPWVRVVPLPHITSTTLQFMLEYIHTEKMPSCCLTMIQTMDVIRACKSRCFQLPNLEKDMMEWLESSRSKTSSWQQEIALDFSLAELGIRLGNRVHETLDSIRYLYSFRLQEAQLKPSHLWYLSKNAFLLYSDNTKSTTLFGEYHRFRHIILWCAAQACPAKEEDKVLDDLVPGQAQVIAYLRTLPSCRTESFGFDKLKSLLKDQQKCAVELLEKVNFVHIHSELLSAVVEPLVIPLSMVSEERMREAYKKAYRLQAVQGTPKPPQYAWESWDYCDRYSTCRHGSGSTVTKSLQGLNLARYPFPIIQNHGVYEWAITVKRASPGFCELGFLMVYEDYGRVNYGRRLGCLEPTSVSASGGLCLKITPKTARTNRLQLDEFRSFKTIWDEFGKDFERLNARVAFRLDLNKQVCSIAVNDDDYKCVWVGLPSDRVYFPAVCLGRKVGGRVRIQLGRGFDIL